MELMMSKLRKGKSHGSEIIDDKGTELDTIKCGDSETPSSPSSVGAETTQGTTHVYNFDIEKYKQGAYQLVCASDERIHYVGRFLRHPENAQRKTKINTVQFDWPLTSFSLRVRGTQSIAIRLKGKGNYFNVFLNGMFSGKIIKATLNAACCEVANDLDINETYSVCISKRTEPQMRGAVSTFKVCTFYGFILDADASILPPDEETCSTSARKIEFIGDSDTCAFGNEGETSSTKNFFNMKGRLENAYNGFAGIVSRMLHAEAHVLAWSGKGIHSNTLDWGPTMRTLWRRTLASRESTWDTQEWQPDVVVLHLGGNDLLPPTSSESEIIESYTTFLEEIRTLRPQAHIFCLVCDEGCISSEDTLENRRRVSLQLQEITKVAMSRVRKLDDKLHYTFICVPGGFDDTDYANMMHYSVSGHQKFADVLANEISEKTGWKICEPTSTMAFPPDKKDILRPNKDSHSCVIS